MRGCTRLPSSLMHTMMSENRYPCMLGRVSTEPAIPRGSARIARRRERMRNALLSAGARQFAARGVATVSVAELIAEADVSRATFYQFFSNKYSLLEDILNPIFDYAVARVRALAAEPALHALDGVIDVYCALWREHRDGLLLIPDVDPATFRRFEARHRALNDALLEVLTAAEREGLLRNGSAHFSLKVIARTAIPLLRVYHGHPAAETLFRDALRCLLVAESPESPGR
jgi:AcrR family transcriptional regulator